MANNEVKLRLSVDGAKAVLSDFDRVRSGMSGVSDAATTAAGAMRALGAAFSVGAVVAWGKAMIDAADAMNDMSQRVGIAVKDLAKYELAASQSGTTMETLARGIKGLAGNLVEHGAALKKAGIDTSNADKAMQQLANVFASMPDGVEKTNLAVKLFGKSGMDMIPMLNLGAAGLQTAAEKSAAYATQMAAMAPLADAFNDNMAVTALNSKTLSMTMFNEVLPSLVKVTEAMTQTNDQGSSLASMFGKGLRTAFETVALIASDVIFVFQGVGREIGGIAAQVVAAATGNWAGFSAISDAMKADAKKAREELDRFQENLVSRAEKVQTAYNKRQGFGEQVKSGTSGSTLLAALGADKAGTEAAKAANALLKERIELAKWNTKAVDELFDAQEKVRLQTEDQIKTARTTLEQIEFETRLLEMNTEQRAQATLERELERQGIVKGTLAYDAYIVKLREAMAIKTGKEAGIKAADDMREAQQKAAEESAKYWEDALLRAFESGKGFFESLWSTIKNTLKTQILKVTVQGVMGTLGIGATGAAFAGGAGGSDILGLANTASSLANLYSAGSSIITIGSQVAAGTMGIANALGTLAANATGTGISGLLAANGAFGTAAAGTASAAAGSLTAGLAAIPGWGWAALGVAAVASIFGGGGETRSGATYDNVGGTARYQQGPSGGEIAGSEARRLFNVATSSIEAALAAVGSKAKLTGFTAGLESSGKGRGFDFAGGFIDGVGFGEYSGREGDKNGQFPLKSQSAEQAFANYATQLKQATVQALQAATDVPQTIKDMLSGVNANALTGEAVDALLGNINAVVGMVNGFNQAVLALPFANLKNLSFDAAAGLLAVTGGLDALGANLASYYDTYYSESERMAMTTANVSQALAKVNVAMPATKDAYREVVTALDLTTDAGRNTYAVMLALAPEFAQVADAAEAARQATQDMSDAMGKTVASAFAELRDLVEAAEGDLVDAFNSAASALADTATRFASIQDIFKDFAQTLAGATGAGQSVAYLRGEFTRLSDLARLGDAGAASKAVGVGDQLAARIVATSTRRDADLQLARLAAQANATASIAEQQKSIAQQQLDTLKEVVGKLVDVEGKTLSVEEAMNTLRVLQSVENTSIAGAIAGGFGNLLASGSLTLDGVAKSTAAIGKGNELAASILSGINTMAGIQQAQEAERLAIAEAAEDERIRQAKIAELNQTGLSAAQAYQSVTSTQQAAVGGVKASISDIWSLASAYGLTLQAQAGQTGNTAQFGVDEAGKFAATYNQISGDPGNFAAFKSAFYAAGGVYDRTYGQASTLAQLAAQVASASAELERQRELVRALGAVPAFAVGTNYIPQDMLARVHKGEAIVPAAYNPVAGGSGNGDLLAELRALRKQVADLQAANTRENVAIASHAALTADATRRMDKNGVLVYTDPAEPLLTEVAA